MCDICRQCSKVKDQETRTKIMLGRSPKLDSKFIAFSIINTTRYAFVF